MHLQIGLLSFEQEENKKPGKEEENWGKGGVEY